MTDAACFSLPSWLAGLVSCHLSVLCPPPAKWRRETVAALLRRRGLVLQDQRAGLRYPRPRSLACICDCGNLWNEMLLHSNLVRSTIHKQSRSGPQIDLMNLCRCSKQSSLRMAEGRDYLAVFL